MYATSVFPYFLWVNMPRYRYDLNKRVLRQKCIWTSWFAYSFFICTSNMFFFLWKIMEIKWKLGWSWPTNVFRPGCWIATKLYAPHLNTFVWRVSLKSIMFKRVWAFKYSGAYVDISTLYCIVQSRRVM